MIRLAFAAAVFNLVSCSPSESTWVKPATVTLGCKNYQSIILSHAILYNNVWNKSAAKDFDWEQCLEQKPQSDPIIYGWSWRWPSTGHQIFSYPQIKVGSSPWQPLPKINDSFPAKLDQLESLTISHELELQIDGQLNIATSMWLTHSPDIGDVPNKSVIAAEVMVWTYVTENHMNPAGRNIGTIEGSGRKWSVWVNKNWSDVSGQNQNKWIYITFKAEKSQLSSEFDIVALLSSSLLSDLKLENSYIADIELGTEIMRGEGLVWVNGFNVDIKSR